MKKIIFVLICVILMNIFGGCGEKNVEILHEIPTNSNDLILSYYQAGAGKQNLKQYLITIDGNLTVIDDFNRKYVTDLTLYSFFNNYVKEKINTISISPLSDELLLKISKVNVADVKTISKDNNSYVQLPSQKTYLIAQKTNGIHAVKNFKFDTNDFTIEWIYYIRGEEVKKNRSPYTDEIIEYIDYAVSEAKKAGL